MSMSFLMKKSVLAVTALCFTRATQAIVTTCPSSNICYALSVPETTASSSDGDVYFQISGPTSYQYVALGQGSQMAGSHIFVLYTSSDGNNVTISPRLGTGYRMPEYTSSTNLDLLEGSGVENGIMTANVRCSNCNSWEGGSMDFSSSSATWIWATASGSSLDSDDLDASIPIHDSYSSFDFDLNRARGGSEDANPFSSSSSSTGNTTSDVPASPSGSSSSTSSGGASTSSNSVNPIILAHGVMAAVAFVALFPIGGILIRVANFTGLVWVHAALQIVALMTYIAAFGIGIHLAITYQKLSTAHAAIGIIAFILVVLQPTTGWLHHRLFKKYNHRTLWSYSHLWIGRTAIILGMINGGLGLALAGAGRSKFIAYGVCAGVVGVVYIAAVVFGERGRKQNTTSPTHEKHQRRRQTERMSSSEEDVGRRNGGHPQEYDDPRF